MRLIDALRVSAPGCISFVGAGGKTTALFQAARELLDGSGNLTASRTVLVTTTTHLGSWQPSLADHVQTSVRLGDLYKLRTELPEGVVLVAGEEKEDRLDGLQGAVLDELHRMAADAGLPLLVEADGAHGCPLKAPDDHEPAVPGFSDQVVVVAGLAGLGKPLSPGWVHRPDRFASLAGLQAGDEISKEALAKVLLDKHGGLKHIPCGARKVVLLNQADTPGLMLQAKELGEDLIEKYEGCIIAALNPGSETSEQKGIHSVIEPVAGIILAAGSSSRFGQPKQLLAWKGEPLVRQVARVALEAGLAPVVVVVGSSAEDLGRVLKDLPLRIVNNFDWQAGMSSSIKAGLKSIDSTVGGAVFLQADQPQIPASLVRGLVEAHQSSLQPIVAPQVNGQRGNPVLFDTCTFPALLELEGDRGGRVLFDNYAAQWVTWQDERILIDIDSPQDYARLLKAYTQEEKQG